MRTIHFISGGTIEVHQSTVEALAEDLSNANGALQGSMTIKDEGSGEVEAIINLLDVSRIA